MTSLSESSQREVGRLLGEVNCVVIVVFYLLCFGFFLVKCLLCSLLSVSLDYPLSVASSAFSYVYFDTFHTQSSASAKFRWQCPVIIFMLQPPFTISAPTIILWHSYSLLSLVYLLPTPPPLFCLKLLIGLFLHSHHPLFHFISPVCYQLHSRLLERWSKMRQKRGSQGIKVGIEDIIKLLIIIYIYI
jgi:uncharacterized membrane protein